MEDLKIENMLENELENIVCAIDIGTSKVAALAGKRNQHGKIELIGIGNCPSFGVQRGVVTNIAKTVESIKKAVIEAERQSGIKFTKVHVGIAGQHIKSLQHRGILTRNNNDSWINYEDIQKLKNEMYKLALPPGDKILHVLPQEYIVDNEPGIYQEPIGMMGIRLEGNFHIITGAETAIQNIERCINIAGLEVASIELEPLASADSVLGRDELEAGVCLVDIGGGTTDIAIFENFIIRHTAVIPFGGNIITEDLRDLKILRDMAEKIKIMHGCAVTYESLKNENVSIPALRDNGSREINLLAITKVISARMKEILAHVDFQIKLSGFSKKLIGGIVLTGGGSKLRHLVQLTEMETGQHARLGVPKEHMAPTKLIDIENPIYATGIGLLIRAFKQQDEDMLYKNVQKTKTENQEPQKIVTPNNPILEIPKLEEKPTQDTVVATTKKEENIGAKKVSLFSVLGKKIENYLKSDNDFSDI